VPLGPDKKIKIKKTHTHTKEGPGKSMKNALCVQQHWAPLELKRHYRKNQARSFSHCVYYVIRAQLKSSSSS